MKSFVLDLGVSVSICTYPVAQKSGDFSGLKAFIQMKIERIWVRILAYKPVHYVSLTDTCSFFYHIFCKTIEISIFNVNNNSFPCPLIMGVLDKGGLQKERLLHTKIVFGFFRHHAQFWNIWKNIPRQTKENLQICLAGVSYQREQQYIQTRSVLQTENYIN